MVASTNPEIGGDESSPVQLVAPTATPPSSRADLNLRIFTPLAHYIRDKHGEAVLAEVLAKAELDSQALAPTNYWVSWDQFERLLAGARALVADDEAFRDACSYRYAEGYGALRFVLWALSPRTVYELGARNIGLITSVAKMSVVARSEHELTLRYSSTKPESRLMCLSRQGQTRAMPTLWGLPPAEVTPTLCIADGDECCEYQVRVFSHRRWLPVALGACAGVGVLFALSFTGWLEPFTFVALPLLGALIGYANEMRRTHRANVQFANETYDALRSLARDEAEARREILNLHQRQRDWTQVLEESIAHRTRRVAQMVDQIHDLDQKRLAALRGVSHDLRNPLTFLRAEAFLLRDYLDDADPEARELLEAHEEAVSRMDVLINELLKSGANSSSRLPLSIENVDVVELAERVRSRLRALLRGTNVRGSVLVTREAPTQIEGDPMMLDQILDNLLTNAASVTDRGSIVVEVDGTPGNLVFKISDTGPGLSPDRFERSLRPRRPEDRLEGRYAGLESIVQLLDQIGGRLEVMSANQRGTTFWVHVPVRPRASDLEPSQSSPDEVVSRVVKFRRETR